MPNRDLRGILHAVSARELSCGKLLHAFRSQGVCAALRESAANFDQVRVGDHQGIDLSERDRRQRFVSQQIHYTLEARDAEYELLPISVDQGLGVLVWSPLAGGLLSGKHRRNQAAPEGSRQFAGWTEPPIRDENRLWDIVETLVSIAEGRGVSAAQIALAWLVGRKAVTSVVIGGRTEAQFKDNLAASELTLSVEERKLLDDVSLPPLLYPYWHQRNEATDRLSKADLELLSAHLK
ncbi:aldo/keto reductase [Rhizobium rhizogenes]|uniref:aldo/keto reductase n=1 Tax=Rhizobium rhizogenes TaxID=359 RepID=UPI00286855C5|nr:aldo/keto reductase [Rhizobium rhizogenes]